MATIVISGNGEIGSAVAGALYRAGHRVVAQTAVITPAAVVGAILGVILFLTGAQLALGSCEFSKDKGERFITLVTAAFCIWNVGLGFLAGMVGAYLNKRGLLKL